MKTIKDYLLTIDPASTQSIYLPKNSEVFTASYYSSTALKLFVLTDPIETDMELRKFRLYNLNENIYINDIKYISSFKEFPGRFLFEVF